MNRTIHHISMLLLALVFVAGAPALVTQTVNPADSAATIQTAIDTVLASADPDKEVVFNAGTYVLAASLEVIVNSDGNVTLRGASAATRPVLVCPDYVGGTVEDGCISVGGATTTVTIRDLIILPPNVGGSDYAAPNTIGIGGRATLEDVTLNFINLAIVPNNGSNQPYDPTGGADPQLDGNTTGFANACINLIPSTTTAHTLIIGGTDVRCSGSGAEGFFLGGDGGGPLAAHWYDSAFSWNAADGYRHTDIGSDDRFYRCYFIFNGRGSNNQGMHSSSNNPGADRDGNGGHTYMEACEASGNSDRGFYLGSMETAVIRNCTGSFNGLFGGETNDEAWGLHIVDGCGLVDVDGFYAESNRGGSVQVNNEVGGTVSSPDPGTEVVLRNIVSKNCGNNNTSGTSAWSTASGIVFTAESCTVEDCLVENTAGVGIYRYLGPTRPEHNTTIRNCTIRHTGLTGILLERGIGGLADLLGTHVIENCVIEDSANNPDAIGSNANMGNGIRYTDASEDVALIVRGCTIDTVGIGSTTDGGAGIRVDEESTAITSGSILVADTLIRDATRYGTYIEIGSATFQNVEIDHVELTIGLYYRYNEALSCLVEDCTVTNTTNHRGMSLDGNEIRVRRCYVEGAGRQGIYQNASANPTLFEVEDCVVQSCGESYLAVDDGFAGKVRITNFVGRGGTQTAPGIQFTGGKDLELFNVDIFDASPYGIAVGAVGITPATALTIDKMDQLCIAGSFEAALQILSSEASASPRWQLMNSTLHNNPVGILVDAVNFQMQPMEVIDCIIASASDTGIKVNTVVPGGSINVTTSALVQEGADALDTAVDDANPTTVVTQSNVIGNDPVFASTTPGDVDYLAVRSTALGGMATGVGPGQDTNLDGCSYYIGDVVGLESWRRF